MAYMATSEFKATHLLTTELELASIPIHNGLISLCRDSKNMYIDIDNERSLINKKALNDIDEALNIVNTVTELGEMVVDLSNSLANVTSQLTRISTLERENSALKTNINDLKAKLTALENAHNDDTVFYTVSGS